MTLDMKIQQDFLKTLAVISEIYIHEKHFFFVKLCFDSLLSKAKIKGL